MEIWDVIRASLLVIESLSRVNMRYSSKRRLIDRWRQPVNARKRSSREAAAHKAAQCICNIMLCNIACTRSRLHRDMVSSPPRRHLDVPRIELRSLLCHKSGRRASSVPYTFHKLSNNCRSVFVVRAMLHPSIRTQSANRFATTSAKSLHFFARIYCSL